VTAERAFRCDPTSSSAARRFVRQALRDVPADVGDAAALLASELASNACQHAATDFVVRVDHTADRVRVEVSDTGPGQPVPRAPTAGELSGRGLRIVDALADDWGVAARPDGKVVWFTLAIVAARPVGPAST